MDDGIGDAAGGSDEEIVLGSHGEHYAAIKSGIRADGRGLFEWHVKVSGRHISGGEVS